MAQHAFTQEQRDRIVAEACATRTTPDVVVIRSTVEHLSRIFGAQDAHRAKRRALDSRPDHQREALVHARVFGKVA